MINLIQDFELLASEDVPQADDLHKVHTLVSLIHNQPTLIDDEQLAREMGIVDRQVRYYKAAARILGFLDSKNRITEQGENLVSSSDYLSNLVTAFQYSHIGMAWSAYYHKDNVLDVPLAEEEVIKFLDYICPSQLSLSTKKRRAHTLIKWVQEYRMIIRTR
ncbi:hypothetical protein NYR77_09190 [Actinobacillus equuli subsp. haemolyticus]|uniref:DUF7226 domain-containing protein n=1 Tax=Actinobacillus equuli TaxID=718 RepID=UPI002442DC5F|nr:hypothetical protein [Actinobacillus equuli]WGE67148.1 hypothetical protein NYR77_09190 [Actinobacillus equuli subsp. haemolyticus]